MNKTMIESLEKHAKELRDRKDASAADREGAYFIERAVEHLAGADAKRATAAKAAPAEPAKTAPAKTAQP